MHCFKTFIHLIGAVTVSAFACVTPALAGQSEESGLLDIALAPPVTAEPGEASLVTTIVDPASEMPRFGEIKVQGIVQTVDAARGQITLAVTAFSLPNGRAARLDVPKEKIVLINEGTLLLSDGGRTWKLSALQVGVVLTLTGTDTGKGQTMPARCAAWGARIREKDLPPVEVKPVENAPSEPIYIMPVMPVMPSYSGKTIVLRGRMSFFGGPNDMGVGPAEGLALVSPSSLVGSASYFLPYQPTGTTGLARRLNPDAFYIACRWDYNKTPRRYLANIMVTVTNPLTGQSVQARPVDYGPHSGTGRVADLSPGLARQLGLRTDSLCVVQIPLPGV